MSPRLTLYGMLLSFLAFAMVLSQTTPADARKRVCKTDHFHYGSSAGERSKKAARIAAIHAWASFTAFEYGNDWASYRRARSKGIRCERGDSGWSCDVEAVPCRLYRRR